LHRIVEAPPESLAQRVPAVPPAVEALVIHLLQKDPASRPASAEDVVRALDEAATPARSTAATGPSHNGLRRRQFRFGVVSSAVGLLAIIAGYLVWQRLAPVRETPPSGEATVRSLAVLPFENSVGIPADDPLIDGFTDELIGTLGKVRGLGVTPRSSAFALKGSVLNPRTIADTLGVDYLIGGNVRHVGGSYVVFVELIHPRDGSAALWTDTYRGEWKNVFAVQPEIARAIAGALQVRFALPDAPRAGTYSAADSLYLLGRFALYGGMRRQNLRHAEEYFKKAIVQDSMYAKAYSGLSDIYTSVANFGYDDPAVASANARANADRALQLDSTLAEARTSLGHALCTHDYDRKASERELRRALELNPSYSYARRVLATCLRSQARFDEALAQLRIGMRADPLNRGFDALLGRVYVNAGRPDDAIQVLRQATRLNPQSDMAWQQLGHAYLLKGEHGDAIAALQSAARLTGARDSAQLAYAYAVTGDRTTAERIVQVLVASRSQRYVPPVHIAMAYAGLGQTSDAFRWLDLAFDERASSLDGVMVDPGFRSLHGDPRWRLLLAKMGLDRAKQ
jgi:TolB-like protein/Tfp pilus assembly protein PilF